MAHNPLLCKGCIRAARIKRTIQNGSRNQLRRLVAELYDHLLSAEEDAQYYRCILDGSWPDSKEILERALAKLGGKESGEKA